MGAQNIAAVSARLRQEREVDSKATRLRATPCFQDQSSTNYRGQRCYVLWQRLRHPGRTLSKAQTQSLLEGGDGRDTGSVLPSTNETRRAGVSYLIQGAVVDGKRGVPGVFRDIPVQMCQFHQIAIMRRYLTSRPKLEAGKELRAIALALPSFSEESCAALLQEWYRKWESFLKERTYAPDNKHWCYTHKRVRSAYRSIHTNLPYLFTYQKHPGLKMPNTTNSLDGFFNRIKSLLNVHRGLTPKRRYKIIQEILGK